MERQTFTVTFEGEQATFAKAFVAAQAATDAVKKASTNPAFRSKYADLSGVVEAVVPALNTNKIGVMQFPAFDGELVHVTTLFLHESGASIRGTLSLKPSKLDPQGVGSAITYGRRYSLLAMSGAAPEDDDGNEASRPASRPANLSVAPEGNDWWGCEGSGPSSNKAKAEGLGDVHEALREQLSRVSSADEWRAWCRSATDDIRKMPRAWRVEMRNEAEEHARELGVDLNDRRAA
ncbi:MAG: ERF family protein [Caulobacter sp.]